MGRSLCKNGETCSSPLAGKYPAKPGDGACVSPSGAARHLPMNGEEPFLAKPGDGACVSPSGAARHLPMNGEEPLQKRGNMLFPACGEVPGEAGGWGLRQPLR